MTTTTVPAARLNMVAQVRTACYAELERNNGRQWTAAMHRVLDTSIECMAAWMRPNDSVWTNMNLALSMADQPRSVAA